MIIYCHACNDNHWFTVGDMERLIYTLQAELCDEVVTAPEDRPNEPRPVDDQGHFFLCLNDYWRASHEPEAYLEFTDGEITSRKFHAKGDKKFA